MDYDPNNTPAGEDEELLREIRERYTYASAAFREIYEESRIDRRYIGGDPWDDKDRKARKDTGRPCLNHDELNQYVNTAVNNLRQNKRGIKIDPDAYGADAKTAELNQDLVRTIEYRSQAQSAYITAYQAQLEGSLGFFRISRRYSEDDPEKLTQENWDHQELVVRNIANPESVLFDPDCKEADWSDAEYCFVLSPISREEFKRRYPKARIRDFSTEQMRVAHDWLQDRMVLTAEYWRIETGKEETSIFAGGKRTTRARRIMQYVTNGIEILSRTPEPGSILPIVPVIGKEEYVDEGAGPQRRIKSLVRLARDPQMSLAYLVSQEAEEAGLTPKVPYKGYVGQFETDSDAWSKIHRVPRAYIQADPIVDGATGAVLPLPVREQFTPNFQQYEIAKDSARRAIQAAMGISSLPTAAQRDNQKSGVAIERIQSAQDVGSFHFLDNFDRALMLAGRIIEERKEVVYGQPDREMMLRRADESHRKVRLNTEEPYLDAESNEMVHYPIDKGTHTVTISVGPWHESQKAEQGAFVDTLIGNLKNLPITPPAAAKILAIAIRMKELGPLGDQLADIISPPEPPGGEQIPPQAQQAIAQAQQMMQGMQAEMQKLQLEKAGHVIQGQFDVQIEKMKLENALAVAEISTKAQQLSERVQLLSDMMSQFHDQAHDAALQAQQQAHERDQATAAAQQQQQAEPQPALVP